MTAQCPEILLYRGKEMDMCACPLEDYLSRLRKDKRPPFTWTSTANRRGYVGTWRIDEGTLHLVDLEGTVEVDGRFRPISKQEAFPWVRGPLTASWFTGSITCPEGRLIDYVHQGFGSVYERDRVLVFKRGRLTEEYLFLNPPEPIVYRITEAGERVCVERATPWDRPIPDPLEGRDLSEAHLVWGQPPVPRDGDDDGDAADQGGYVLGGALVRGPVEKR